MSKAKRSLRASQESMAKLRLARLKFASQNELAKRADASLTTVKRFLSGQAISREKFHSLCEKLGLPWEEIAELPEDVEVQSNKQEQDSKLNLEPVVQQTIARKITVIDEQNQDIKSAVVILEGDFASVQRDVLIWYNYLSEKYPNTTIKVKTIKFDSTNFTTDGSQEDVEIP
ncbi:helix-turn-helix domain-containing protein [Funiculus sociatus]|uniref:helix-turn-helix domain-containing protein n=1 Tax=Funiculus sociatus TaxID=450527 RepID=UPI0032979179